MGYERKDGGGIIKRGWEEEKKKKEKQTSLGLFSVVPTRLAVLLYCFIVLICRVHIKKYNTHDRTRVFSPTEALCLSRVTWLKDLTPDTFYE